MVIDDLQSVLIIGEIVTYHAHFSNYNFYAPNSASIFTSEWTSSRHVDLLVSRLVQISILCPSNFFSFCNACNSYIWASKVSVI